MMGHKTGVAKRIQDLQPKAYPTHCHGHSLSLSVKDTTKNCKLLSDTMDTAKEIVSLIKFSPKRENLLGEIKENLEGPESEAKGMIGLCPTRWTVRASCFQRILDNYTALLQEWTISLDEKLQSDIRGRIIGCQAQMNTFDFFFGLNLGQRLFSHTDNLSKTLQQTKMSAVGGKRVAVLTKEVLKKIRDDMSFNSFYDAVLLKSKNYPSMTEPMLPRRTRAPRRIEIGTGDPTYPATARDYYRRIYFEAIDLMVNAIDQRFDQPSFFFFFYQPSFDTYARMESLLVNTLNSQDNSTELQFMEQVYVLLKDGDFLCFDDIMVKIKELLTPERKMIFGCPEIKNMASFNNDPRTT